MRLGLQIMERRSKILQLIKTENYVTYDELSEILQVSKKTIYNEIIALNDELSAFGAKIESKPRHGLILKISDKKAYEEYLSSLKEEQAENGNGDLRELSIARRIITSDHAIKMDDLCEELYISRSTLNADLKKVKTLFESYELKMESVAYKGTIVKGSEYNKRRCLSEISKKLAEASGQAKNYDMEEIAKILKKVFREEKFRMPEYLFNNLVVHLYIALLRVRSGYSIEEAKGYEDYSDEKERRIADRIVSLIEKKYQLPFPKAETSYITLNLSSRKWNDQKANPVISRKVYEVVIEMLDEIDQMFHYDFKYDLELVSLLASHVASLQVRLLYDMPLDNPLLAQIREGSLLAFEMANVACSKICQHYGKKVSADEMAYIALHFHLAMQRRKDRHKKNVLIVCGTGRGSAELVAYNIRRNYGNYLNVVGTHESTDFSDIDFSKYDYVLTTIHISEMIPIPVIEISMVQTRQDENKLNSVLSSSQDGVLREYFKADLFMPHLKAKDKNEILKILCEKAQKEGYASDGLMKRVLKREELGTTSFGNGIAIPHPYRPEGVKSFIVTGILDEPIEYDGDKVNIIFLLSMKEKGDRNLQGFYRSVGKLLSSRKAVDEIVRDQRLEKLLSILDTLNQD